MFFNRLLDRLNPDDRAKRWRDAHSRWLTEALAQPSRSFPRIPIARVSNERAGSNGGQRRDEGFSALMSTPDGRDWARQWWDDTFSHVELDDDRRSP